MLQPGHRSTIAAVICVVLGVACEAPGADTRGPWPAPVPGWQMVEPSEHPRLLFRRAEIRNEPVGTFTMSHPAGKGGRILVGEQSLTIEDGHLVLERFGT